MYLGRPLVASLTQVEEIIHHTICTDVSVRAHVIATARWSVLCSALRQLRDVRVSQIKPCWRSYHALGRLATAA